MTVFLDNSSISKLKSDNEIKSNFVEKCKSDSLVVYISDKTLEEAIDGDSDDHAINRILMISELSKSLLGQIKIPKSLPEIIKIEFNRSGLVKSTPYMCQSKADDHLSQLGNKEELSRRRPKLLSEFRKDDKILDKQHELDTLERLKDGRDHDIINDYKNFRGMTDSRNHRSFARTVLGRYTKISNSKFKNIVHKEGYTAIKNYLNLAYFYHLRVYLPKDYHISKKIKKLDRNDLIDFILMSQAAYSDVLVTEDGGMLEIGNELFKRNAIKYKCQKISQFLQG